MRRNYIDNLRNLTILLLFPVHTFMIWNDFGSGFYIWLGENKVLSTWIVLINPWFMPVLFVLAGMSARYALEKRTVKEFIVQRVKKLLFPFIGGLLFLVPFQTFYARKYFYNYQGGIFANWIYFFTHLTDFSGYDGAFTPGQLWFTLFLFVISVMALFVFHCFPYEKVAAKVERMSAFGVLLLFIPVWSMYYIGNFGGFSLGKSFSLYLLGYYVLSNDSVMEMIERNRKWLLALCIAGTAGSAVLYYNFSYYGDLWVNYIGWNTILVLLVFSKRFFNKRTRFTKYFNKASYPIYIFHQSILVALAYYIVQVWDNTALQVLGIWGGSFVLTILVYHAGRYLIYGRNKCYRLVDKKRGMRNRW